MSTIELVFDKTNKVDNASTT